MVTEMVAEIEKVIETDLPFRQEERAARMGMPTCSAGL